MFRFFEKMVDPYIAYQRTDSPPDKLWPFLKQYLGPFKTVFIYAAGLSIIVAVVELWLISYLGRLIDLMSDASGPQVFWTNHWLELLSVAVFLLLIRPFFQAFQALVLNNSILPNLGTLMRWRAHAHVLRQPVGWFENDFAGRIANRIMQTPPAAGEAVFQVFDAITYALTYFAGAFFLLSITDARLAIPLTAWLGLYAILILWVIKKIGPAARASSKARSEVTARVVDSYTNIHSVKLFAHHDSELVFAKTAIEASRSTFQREMRLFTIMDVVLVIINGLLIVSVVGWAIALWTNGQATVGLVAAASALTLRLNAMTGWIIWALSSFFQNLGIVSEGMQTIAQPIALLDRPNAPKLMLNRGKIEIKNVTHEYGRKGGMGIKNISLTIPAGQKIGLVGHSGAGKTTLLGALLRLYDVDSGHILIDGQNIAGVAHASLVQNIGMVQQDTSLLHRSIYENISYGRPDASLEDVIWAAKSTKAHDFILTLTDSDGRTGYDAHVGERGVKLSGGQRQRITLARVVLKNAPVLLLDEATSALDSEVETAIQETLYDMMAGKTVVAIAHRLSTIANMDRIIVLENGQIAEDGTHADLLRRGGLYARYWQKQSSGFIGQKD